jgi:hypothetical protein
MPVSKPDAVPTAFVIDQFARLDRRSDVDAVISFGDVPDEILILSAYGDDLMRLAQATQVEKRSGWTIRLTTWGVHPLD